ncbi:MAG: HIT domain-containing protein [Acidilobus sp.]
MEPADTFCRIARGEERAYVIYQDEDIMMILDKAPVSLGHALVITREHYEGVQDAPPRLLAKVWVAASAAATFLRKVREAPGVKVVTNSGSPAGQVVFHFHVHVIPSWEPGPFRRGVRHDLTEEEAQRAIRLYEGVQDVIRSYLKEVG